MSTKLREVIVGGAIMGANMRVKKARQAAETAIREASRAEAYAWSVRMKGYGGPALPSPTIAQCITGRYGFLEVKCHRCDTIASIPLSRWSISGVHEISRSGSWRRR